MSLLQKYEECWGDDAETECLSSTRGKFTSCEFEAKELDQAADLRLQLQDMRTQKEQLVSCVKLLQAEKAQIRAELSSCQQVCAGLLTASEEARRAAEAQRKRGQQQMEQSKLQQEQLVKQIFTLHKRHVQSNQKANALKEAALLTRLRDMRAKAEDSRVENQESARRETELRQRLDNSQRVSRAQQEYSSQTEKECAQLRFQLREAKSRLFNLGERYRLLSANSQRDKAKGERQVEELRTLLGEERERRRREVQEFAVRLTEADSLHLADIRQLSSRLQKAEEQLRQREGRIIELQVYERNFPGLEEKIQRMKEEGQSGSDRLRESAKEVQILKGDYLVLASLYRRTAFANIRLVKELASIY